METTRRGGVSCARVGITERPKANAISRFARHPAKMARKGECFRRLPSDTKAFPVKKGSLPMLYLLVSTQFRTQNCFALLLELL
jgi:hypothetical protein